MTAHFIVEAFAAVGPDHATVTLYGRISDVAKLPLLSMVAVMPPVEPIPDRDPRSDPRPGDCTESTRLTASTAIRTALYVVQRVTQDKVWYVDLLDDTRELQDIALAGWRVFARHDRVVYTSAPWSDGAPWPTTRPWRHRCPRCAKHIVGAEGFCKPCRELLDASPASSHRWDGFWPPIHEAIQAKLDAKDHLRRSPEASGFEALLWRSPGQPRHASHRAAREHDRYSHLQEGYQTACWVDDVDIAHCRHGHVGGP